MCLKQKEEKLNNKDIGLTIYNLRKSRNLTQKELSEKIFVSQKAISKWETGDGVPELANLMGLAKVFNVSSDYILQGLGSYGIENLNSTYKRYNMLENDSKNFQTEDAKPATKKPEDKQDEVKKKSEKEIKEKKLNIDGILKLVDNAANKSVNVARETIDLASKARKDKALNKVEIKKEDMKTKKSFFIGPLISFLINLILIVMFIFMFQKNDFEILINLFFTSEIIFLAALASLILSIIALVKKGSKNVKVFSIINIIFTIAVIATFLILLVQRLISFPDIEAFFAFK